jgi:hypothetical protein
MDKPLIKEPPAKIDGATVLLWAWSGAEPFGYVGDIDSPDSTAIYGLAICTYGRPESFYRFSCDINWETAQDGVYTSAEEAVRRLPDQYRQVEAEWQTM